MDFTYNARGAQTQQTETLSDGTTQEITNYDYDAAGRLAKITAGSDVSKYLFNGQGQRVQQTTDVGTANEKTTYKGEKIKMRKFGIYLMEGSVVGILSSVLWSNLQGGVVELYDSRYIMNLAVFLFLRIEVVKKVDIESKTAKIKFKNYIIEVSIVGIWVFMLLAFINIITPIAGIVSYAPLFHILALYVLSMISPLLRFFIEGKEEKILAVIIPIIGMVTICICYLIFKLSTITGLIYTLLLMNLVSAIVLIKSMIKSKRSDNKSI